MNKFEKEIIVYGKIDKKVVELCRYPDIYTMGKMLKIAEIESGTYCRHISSSLYRGRFHGDFFHLEEGKYGLAYKARFHMFCETPDGETIHKNEIVESHQAYQDYRAKSFLSWRGGRGSKPRKGRHYKLPPTVSELAHNLGDYEDLRELYGNKIVRQKRLKTNLNPWNLEKKRSHQRNWKSQRKTQYKT